MSTSFCVDVGSVEYCNITQVWTPRISVVGGWCAILIPIILPVVAMLFLFWANREETKATYDKYVKDEKFSAVDVVTGTIQRRDDDTELERLRDDDTVDDTVNVTVNETVNEVKGCYCCCSLQFVGCCKCKLLLKGCLGRTFLFMTLIGLPLFKALWDVLDVGADAYYFYKLERGELINANITRNKHVNNSIMAFAVLGAIKSVLVILFYFNVVEWNAKRDGTEYHGKVAGYMFNIFLFKIFLEDAPELILEYFYVDKYVTDNQPWFLVGKDIGTAFIYIMPLITIGISGISNYKKLSNSKSRVFYVWTTITRVIFGIAMFFRVVGMIIQYTRGDIASACLEVTNGALVQTPFNAGCLNPVDWIVLVFTTVTLIILVFPVILLIGVVIYLIVKGIVYCIRRCCCCKE